MSKGSGVDGRLRSTLGDSRWLGDRSLIGNKTRDHSDIEIAILREDQQRMKNTFADWSFQKVVNGELVEWESETLELPIHELHGKHKKSGKCLEVLLNEVENDLWIFRREPTITFPGSTLFLISKDEIPYLHPAIVLLYKAKNDAKR